MKSAVLHFCVKTGINQKLSTLFSYNFGPGKQADSRPPVERSKSCADKRNFRPFIIWNNGFISVCRASVMNIIL